VKVERGELVEVGRDFGLDAQESAKGHMWLVDMAPGS